MTIYAKYGPAFASDPDGRTATLPVSWFDSTQVDPKGGDLNLASRKFKVDPSEPGTSRKVVTANLAKQIQDAGQEVKACQNAVAALLTDFPSGGTVVVS